LRADSLRDLLLRSLWGNRADLSLSCGEVDTDGRAHDSTHATRDNDHLLVDDSARVVELLSATGGLSRVAVVLDNCGLEFVSDLAMVDVWLHHKHVSVVELHCKAHPVFVSDVMIKDVHNSLDWMAAHGTAGADVAARLRAALDSGRLILVDHPFYTSPRALWELPSELRERFARCDLVVFKGDGTSCFPFGEETRRRGGGGGGGGSMAVDFCSDV